MFILKLRCRREVKKQIRDELRQTTVNMTLESYNVLTVDKFGEE
jgi:hypothetical protein